MTRLHERLRRMMVRALFGRILPTLDDRWASSRALAQALECKGNRQPNPLRRYPTGAQALEPAFPPNPPSRAHHARDAQVSGAYAHGRHPWSGSLTGHRYGWPAAEGGFGAEKVRACVVMIYAEMARCGLEGILLNVSSHGHPCVRNSKEYQRGTCAQVSIRQDFAERPDAVQAA